MHPHPSHAPSASDAPSVSVIVAAYNVQRYIAQCLHSLKRQTLESLQLIVVDDGSTDSTPEKIKELIEGDGHRIEYIRQDNGGLSAARNTGMKAATGAFIGFVDADDWVSPDMFEKLYARALETDSEIVVCAGRKRIKKRARGRIRLRIPVEEFGTSVTNNPEILWGAHSYAWNKIYSRGLIERESFEFPVGKIFEDSSAVYGLMLHANRVDAVNEALYQYRIGRPDAITRRADARIYDIFDSCESFRHSLAPLSDEPGGEEVVERLARTHLLARFPAMRNSRSPVRSAMFTYRALTYLDTYYPGWRSRYDQGGHGRGRYLSRRSIPLAVAVSILRPMRNIAGTATRRARGVVRGQVDTTRGEFISAIAARRVDRALRSASIPYTLDFTSLRQANLRKRLKGRVEVTVLPGEHSEDDITVPLRQQRFRLVRSYMQGERCIAQRWRFGIRRLGNVFVEVRFLESMPDGSVRTKFFVSGDGQEVANQGSVAELRTVPPGPVADRSIPLAGVVSSVDPTDPFAATRTSPDFRRPRNFERLAAELPDVEIEDGEGRYFDGMPPISSATGDLARAEQMAILDQLLEFCEAEGLAPILGDGSLLGAVRHCGYIPWDDDIDIWMVREDFDRLIASELPDGLAVLHHTTNPHFHLGLAKIVGLNSAFGWSYPADLEPAGANIDIFPLDWSASPERTFERLRARLVRLIRQVIRTKYRFPEASRRPSRVVLARMLSGYRWHRLLHAVVTAPPVGRRTNLTSWFSAYPSMRASYPAKWVLPTSTRTFERFDVAAPNDPERVLVRTYGDFTALPHPAKRTTANHFLVFRGGQR